MKSKQILDIQQMQHLKELGLELKDTMLYWIKPLDAVIGIVVGLENDWQLDFIDDKKRKYLKYIPAYTLQDVLDALPKYYHIANIGWTKLSIRVHTTKEWEIRYVYTDELSKYAYQCRKTEKNLIDASYELLVWCIENKFIETNKNE